MATSDDKKPLVGEEKPAGPSLSAQALGALAIAVMGAALLALGGLAVAAVVTTAAVATPLVLFLSPILLPAAVCTVITTAVGLVAGAAAMAALVLFSWAHGYLKGRPVVGGAKVESMQRSLAETVEAVKEKAGEVMVATTTREKASDTKEKGQERPPPQKPTSSSYQEASGMRGKSPA